jgi:YVTN family beta-propeller protein
MSKASVAYLWGSLLGLALGASQNPAYAADRAARAQEKAAVESSVAARFRLEPAGERKHPAGNLVEGEDAVLKFELKDAATHAPIKGLHPAAWMNVQAPPDRGKTGGEPPTCKDKVQAFLQGGLAARPTVDFNTFFILALNDDASLSVIDPLLGFGSSKLVTQVRLQSPGKDWALDPDADRLYVTLPASNRVAVVDTATWKVVSNIDVGTNPVRIALQPDGKYLWVGHDGAEGSEGRSGVSAIDTETLKEAARIATGHRHHELAFSDDNRYVFVSNRDDGTVTTIDVRKLAQFKEVKTGSGTASLAFSPLGKTLLVAHDNGSVAALNGRTLEQQARIETAPGLGALRVSPDGRWAFAANAKQGKVYVIDASTQRLAHTLDVGPGPDQISFTGNYAYIHSTATEQVSMIPLAVLDQGKPVAVARFSGGQAAPGLSSHPAAANAIAPTPEGNTVLVANPVDKTIYYYSEGMAAPMGNFQNYGREPRAVQVVDRRLKETAPGVYSANVRLPSKGAYDVALLVDNPRFYQCYAASVEPNPALKKADGPPLRVEFLVKDRRIRAGEATPLRFRLTDPATHSGIENLKDVEVQTLLAPGTWHKSDRAQSVGGGIYQLELLAPYPGIYYVSVQSPSMKARFDQLPYLILKAADESKTAQREAGEPSP